MSEELNILLKKPIIIGRTILTLQSLGTIKKYLKWKVSLWMSKKLDRIVG